MPRERGGVEPGQRLCSTLSRVRHLRSRGRRSRRERQSRAAAVSAARERPEIASGCRSRRHPGLAEHPTRAAAVHPGAGRPRAERRRGTAMAEENGSVPCLRAPEQTPQRPHRRRCPADHRSTRRRPAKAARRTRGMRTRSLQETSERSSIDKECGIPTKVTSATLPAPICVTGVLGVSVGLLASTPPLRKCFFSEFNA